MRAQANSGLGVSVFGNLEKLERVGAGLGGSPALAAGAGSAGVALNRRGASFRTAGILFESFGRRAIFEEKVGENLSYRQRDRV